VIAKLRDENRAWLYAVHDSVFVIDSSRPETRERVLERFGFTDARVGISLDFLNQQIDPFDQFPVVLLPVQIIFPSLI
jgi:hypothetical protein